MLILRLIHAFFAGEIYTGFRVITNEWKNSYKKMSKEPLTRWIYILKYNRKMEICCMAIDKDKHQQIRIDILKNIDWKGTIYSSHERKGEIHFSRINNGEPISLAYPDIVLQKEDKILIVEIEKTNTPKHLLGVAFAIHSSNNGKFGKGVKNLIDLKDKKMSLILVLDSEKLCINKPGKRESGKPDQIKEIKSLIKKFLVDFEYFDIVTEKTAVDAIRGWIANKPNDIGLYDKIYDVI